jgi:DHA3 family tetracycline resistance protein-like MFS transporter
VALLQPLRQRDFALLFAAMAVSLVGDGIYLVAVAWAAYDLRNDPAALALVGLAFSLGMVSFLLIGGVASDRLDRRRVMFGADVVRALALAVAGALAVSGALELWQLVALAALYGIGDAFFGPAFHAIVPELVPKGELVRANALTNSARPLALRAIGPALGGGLVAWVGAGGVFLIDAATFGLSALCVLAIGARPPRAPSAESMAREVAAGMRFVRTQTWLWATLLIAVVGLLVFWGPVEVLTPYLVRNDLEGAAWVFGAVLAANGAGAVIGSLWMGHRGMPRRPITALYHLWGWATFALCGFALATSAWHLVAFSLLFGAGSGAGMVIWSTLMQSRVPSHLLGRVTSLDYMVSLALVPVSFALVAPVEDWIGVDGTFVAAGLIGGLFTLAVLYAVPGLRERREGLGEPGVGDIGGLHADDLDPLAAGQAGDGAEHGQAVITVRGDRPPL